MKYRLLLLTFMTLLVSAGFNLDAKTTEQLGEIGIVNFRECMENSKFGRQGQASFEDLKKQSILALQEKEKEINTLADNLNDSDYMDSLSPEAIRNQQELFQELNEAFSREQNQYYQMLNQANYKLIQNTQESVSRAAKKIAAKKGFKVVLSEESCFFYTPDIDVTSFIITEMDRDFEEVYGFNNSKEEEL